MKRTPPAKKAMKELGGDELSKDITDCHEMYVVVVGVAYVVRVGGT
jgi:hypothetical protein